jgi:hypothetical protein
MDKSAGGLREEHGHWGSHPAHSVSEWKQEVEADNTRLGYWEWVASILEFEEEFETASETEVAHSTS